MVLYVSHIENKGSELAAEENGEQTKMTSGGMRLEWIMLIFIGGLYYEEVKEEIRKGVGRELLFCISMCYLHL